MLKYREIIFASHNRGKIAEIREMLNPYGIKVLSAADLELPDVEETGKTFEKRLILKRWLLLKRIISPVLPTTRDYALMQSADVPAFIRPDTRRIGISTSAWTNCSRNCKKLIRKTGRLIFPVSSYLPAPMVLISLLKGV